MASADFELFSKLGKDGAAIFLERGREKPKQKCGSQWGSTIVVSKSHGLQRGLNVCGLEVRIRLIAERARRLF